VKGGGGGLERSGEGRRASRLSRALASKKLGGGSPRPSRSGALQTGQKDSKGVKPKRGWRVAVNVRNLWEKRTKSKGGKNKKETDRLARKGEGPK